MTSSTEQGAPVKKWYQKKRFLIPVIIVLLAVMGNIMSTITPVAPQQANNSGDQVSPTTVQVEEVKQTTSQTNAVKKAQSYLKHTGFSESGLIRQLEFEGYSNEDALYAIDNIDIDWNKQAEKKAKSYVTVSTYSRNGLIRQLEFEGFTIEQAIHGAESQGL